MKVAAVLLVSLLQVWCFLGEDGGKVDCSLVVNMDHEQCRHRHFDKSSEEMAKFNEESKMSMKKSAYDDDSSSSEENVHKN